MKPNRAAQQGVVLVFSLLMLLLITLVGVNMLEQNRLQFMMAANAQMQTDDFANAEGVLKLAEEYIASQRYSVWPLADPVPDPVGDTYTCNKTVDVPPRFDQLIPQSITGNLSLSTAEAAITTVDITSTSCMIIGAVEIECEPDSNEASGWSTDETQCNQSDPAQCATEIYTIVVSVSNTNGSNRVIESRYAIRCDM